MIKEFIMKFVSSVSGYVSHLLRSAHTVRGNWPLLHQNLVAGTNFGVPAISPTNSNQFEVLEQVPATCFSKCFVLTVRGTSPCNQSLRVNSSED